MSAECSAHIRSPPSTPHPVCGALWLGRVNRTATQTPQRRSAHPTFAAHSGWDGSTGTATQNGSGRGVLSMVRAVSPRPVPRQPDPRTPVIIGVGQFVHRSASLDDALEPVALMERAVLAASTDAGLDGPPDGRRRARRRPAVVALRQHPAIPRRAPRAHASPPRLHHHGRQQPAVAGQCHGHGHPGRRDRHRHPRRRRGDADPPASPQGRRRTRLAEGRARRRATDHRRGPADEPRGRDRARHLACRCRSTRCSRPRSAPPPAGRSTSTGTTSVGCGRGSARSPPQPLRLDPARPKTPDEITTVTDDNRMIGLPYPKLMNSNNDVDMGAALIMCSVEAARRLGVPEDRWVFPHAGTDCHEHNFISNRDTFSRDAGDRDRWPAGARARRDRHRRRLDHRPLLVLPGRRAARRADRSASTCDRQWSRTGGLTFAGGPWNNYVDARHRHRRHRPARAARRVRAGVGATAATRPSTRSACTPRRRRRTSDTTTRSRGSTRCPVAISPCRPTRPVRRRSRPTR